MGPEQRVFEAGRTETLLQVQSLRKEGESFQKKPISSHLQHVVLYPLAQFDAGASRKLFCNPLYLLALQSLVIVIQYYSQKGI